MLVEFTNLTPDPLTIEAYEFQTKMTAFGKWERVHVVYTDSTNMYWGTNMKHLKKMEFEKPIFDEVALNQFTPNVPVRAWVFMETPKKWPAKYWRMRVRDSHGNVHTSRAFDLDKKEYEIGHNLERHRAVFRCIAVDIDLSHVPRRLHSAPNR